MNDNETVEQAYEDIRKKIKKYKIDSAYEHIACMYTVFAVEDMIDRIEAAAKREREATSENSSQVGNAAKMREALREACYAMFNFLKTQNGGYEEMAEALDKAEAALSAPPRNCDVGTADEQHARFYSFCDKVEVCKKCPLWRGGGLTSKCCARWGQLPYEEVGAK